MNNWRSWAKHGFWDKISGEEFLATFDQSEIDDLVRILEFVVPNTKTPLEGDGPLGTTRRATESDIDRLRETIDNGDYSAGQRLVREALVSFPDPDVGYPLAAFRAREESNAGGQRKTLLRQLRYAANALEILSLGLPREPDMAWLISARDVAIEALHTEGLAYRGLDRTFVSFVGKSKKPVTRGKAKPIGDGTWLQVEKGIGAVRLRNVAADNAPWMGSRVWHAANILLAARTLGMHMNTLPPENLDNEPWNPQDVARHILEATGLAFLVGQHCHALDVKWLERLAQAKAKQNISLQKNNTDLESSTSESNQVIIAKMSEYIKANPNVTSAARRAFNKDGLGTSPANNRSIFYKCKK